MKASVAGRVRNTVLPRTKPLLPVFEAVINAFQAIEETGAKSGQVIHVHATRERTLDEAKPAAFEAFSVSDTGIGFMDGNYESFNIVDSPYKAVHGGKGLGRFLWLKAFARVEIDSHYRNGADSRLLHRRFTFVASDEDQPCTVAPSEETAPRTTVRLIGFRPPYRDESSRGLDVIAHRLVAHFLPLFLDPDAPTITLRTRESISTSGISSMSTSARQRRSTNSRWATATSPCMASACIAAQPITTGWSTGHITAR